MTEFTYVSHQQHVIFGAGALTALAEGVERNGWRRILLCTTGSFRRSGRVAQIEAMLGPGLAAIYDTVQPHVPESQVAEVRALAAEHQVDLLIGLGGGSAIGMAKAVCLALETPPPPGWPRVSVAAIPTTYAGSEMTPISGVTRRQADGSWRKVTVDDPRILPRLVIYDPQLTLDLPPALTASTGLNALAHCVEALYSITGHPLSQAAAASGAGHIGRALPRCWAAGDDLADRTEMLLGAHLAGASLSSTALGLHHGLCHVLGGTAGVPHGMANAIILPHAMRFNADAAMPPYPAPAWGVTLASSMSLDPVPSSAVQAALAAADHVAKLVGQMQLPQRLREVGVPETDLPALAQLAFQNRTVQNNPKPIASPAVIEQLLRAAW
jgi:maleylacetate reductase